MKNKDDKSAEQPRSKPHRDQTKPQDEVITDSPKGNVSHGGTSKSATDGIDGSKSDRQKSRRQSSALDAELNGD